MPKRDAAPIGAPCWVDLFTSDPDRSRAFYGELFGWTSRGGRRGVRRLHQLLQGRRAGRRRHAQRRPAGVPDVWSVYLATDDAQKTVEAAAGQRRPGDRARPWTSATSARWPSLDRRRRGRHRHLAARRCTRASASSAEPGTPGWFELHTRDYDARGALLPRRVPVGHPQRWATRPSSATRPWARARPAGRHHGRQRLPARGRARPLVGLLRRGRHRQALAQIVELGGAIVMPAEDTPYGRLARPPTPPARCSSS